MIFYRSFPLIGFHYAKSPTYGSWFRLFWIGGLSWNKQPRFSDRALGRKTYFGYYWELLKP